jgi:hypothetical protein
MIPQNLVSHTALRDIFSINGLTRLGESVRTIINTLLLIYMYFDGEGYGV